MEKDFKMTPVKGIHHITAVSSNAARTARFYTGLLGMRMVKKTVNFDDPASYHLYFSTDEVGSPGTLLTFFEWKGFPRGRWGIGATHHLAFQVADEEAQLKWKRRLTDARVAVSGPYDRTYFKSIYFKDPDGLILEIATPQPSFAVDEPEGSLGSEEVMPPEGATRRGGRDEEGIRTLTWSEPVDRVDTGMQLRGIHHVTAISSDVSRTAEFHERTLGLRLVKKTFNYDDPSASHWYFSPDPAGSPGTVVTYFGYPPQDMARARMGTGLTHHFAFEVEDGDAQLAVQEHLLDEGIPATEVLDRKYFRSVYFQDPDGHILEVATSVPGFLVDEPASHVGESLSLPSWLENQREDIQGLLTPLEVG